MSFAQTVAQATAGAREYDVCIVGAGAAGITLAIELGKQGRSVLLLEAGPETFDEKSQSEYEGDFFGPRPFRLDLTRLRMFGGTTNHWGGFCRTLDSCDFVDKVPGIDTAWPIGRPDIEPYLERARDILELAPIPADVPLDDYVRHVQFVYSPPVRMGMKFKDELAQSQNIVVVLNAFVANLHERDGRITELEVRSLDNARHFVRARRFVLACGGIENSRILLWANRQNEGRIVKEPRALGRYWMEHPHFTIGEAIAAPALNLQFDAWKISWMAPTEKAMREHGILNCGLRIMPTSYEDTKKTIATLGCIAPDLGRWALRKARRNLVCGLLLRASWEQAPREWNRVTLGNRVDDFGVPRVDMHWRLSDFERRSVRTSATLLGEYLVKANLGRVRLDPWVLGEEDFPNNDELIGNHHLGGTRMSTDPRRGIVDANCRVHGLSNFYVCGSSVFPSGGFANPTLTIVQLACRLSHHLSA